MVPLQVTHKALMTLTSSGVRQAAHATAAPPGMPNDGTARPHRQLYLKRLASVSSLQDWQRRALLAPGGPNLARRTLPHSQCKPLRYLSSGCLQSLQRRGLPP